MKNFSIVPTDDELASVPRDFCPAPSNERSPGGREYLDIPRQMAVGIPRRNVECDVRDESETSGKIRFR